MNMIMVVDSDPKERQKLCRLLKKNNYQTMPVDSPAELLSHIRESPFYAVILDLDSLTVDNRFLRGLRTENPDLCILGVSCRTFHPELEEAMRTHISACLIKPVDPDELIYWLKSICGGEPSSRASPKV